MDSRGNIYAEEAARASLEEELAAREKHGRRRSFIRPLGTNNSGSMIAIADAAIAKELAGMKSRQRRVFYGSRKKGHPEGVSLAKARAAR